MELIVSSDYSHFVGGELRRPASEDTAPTNNGNGSLARIGADVLCHRIGSVGARTTMPITCPVGVRGPDELRKT